MEDKIIRKRDPIKNPINCASCTQPFEETDLIDKDGVLFCKDCAQSL